MRGAATEKARLPTVESLTEDTTRRLVPAERSVRRPCRSAIGTSGPRYRGTELRSIWCKKLAHSRNLCNFVVQFSGTRFLSVCVSPILVTSRSAVLFIIVSRFLFNMSADTPGIPTLRAATGCLDDVGAGTAAASFVSTTTQHKTQSADRSSIDRSINIIF